MDRRGARPEDDPVVLGVDREPKDLETEGPARPLEMEVVVEDESTGEIDEENREDQRE